MALVLILFIVLICYFLVENHIHNKNLSKIKMRILVNGTRGKSTITRLLVIALNESGIKTIGRSTGSEAQIINPDGSVENIIRKRSARIYEMIGFFKKAASENVECVVVECMALQKENQKAIRDKLVRPTDVIICNTFVDHVPEMGTSEHSTAEVLACSVPEGVNLFVAENYYDGLKCNIHHINVDDVQENKGVHPSAISICKAFLENKNINTEYLDYAVDNFIPDKGLLSEFKIGDNSLFVPSFSVNDLTSMKATIEKWKKVSCGSDIYVIFNNRDDREYRILLFDDVIDELGDDISSLYVIGDFKNKVAAHFSKKKKAVAISPKELYEKIINSKDSIYIGLGNIRGDGEKVIELIAQGR